MKTKYIQMYMKMCQNLADASTAERRKVGAIIVTPDNIIVPGMNGMPEGYWTENCENPDGTTHKHTRHAERAAIKKALDAGISLKDSILFCSVEPCLACGHLLYDAGIKAVVFKDDYSNHENATEYLNSLGVKVWCYYSHKKLEKALYPVLQPRPYNGRLMSYLIEPDTDETKKINLLEYVTCQVE